MAAQEDGKSEDVSINISLDYITETWVGKLKVAELVFTLVGAVCGSLVECHDRCGCSRKMGFFDFVAWTAFINVLIDMMIHVLGLWDTIHVLWLWDKLLWIFRHPAVYTVLCFLAVVGFLIGSSVAASATENRCSSSSAAVGAAVFFGFVCLVLFAVECFLHFKESQKHAKRSSSRRRRYAAR